MASINQRNKKFYTEEGLKALQNRQNNLIELFNDGKFKFKHQMLGFGILEVHGKEELKSRIIELSDLTGRKIKFESQIVRFENVQYKKEIIK